MKITKRTREQAALICAIAAERSFALFDSRLCSCIACVQLDLGASERAFWLAEQALVAYVFRDDAEARAEQYAEAEALLRCGWSP